MTNPARSSPAFTLQFQRILLNCRQVWGMSNYDLDVSPFPPIDDPSNDLDSIENSPTSAYAPPTTFTPSTPYHLPPSMFIGIVRRFPSTPSTPAISITGICTSPEDAWAELDRMLKAWARQVRSGEEMTEAWKLEIFGGPGAEGSWIEQRFRVYQYLFADMKEETGRDAVARKTGDVLESEEDDEDMVVEIDVGKIQEGNEGQDLEDISAKAMEVAEDLDGEKKRRKNLLKST